MYDNLYDGIHPLLFDEDPTPGERVFERFKGMLAYLAKQKKEFADIATHSGGVIDITISPVYTLWQETFDKLTEVVDVAKIDIRSAKKQTVSTTKKPIKKKLPSPQLPAPPPPVFDYKYEGMSWHKPKFPSIKSVKLDTLSQLEQAIDIVIMVVTPTELSQVLNLLKPFSDRDSLVKIIIRQETYYLGVYGCFKIAVCKSMMGTGGPTGSTLVAENAIKQWNPLALIMIGIAFGASYTKQKPADVLVARDLFPYETQRVTDRAITYRSPIPPTDATLVNRFDNARDWNFQRPDGTKVDFHLGRMFSGEKLIDSQQFKARLMKREPEAIGGEMEGAGVWAAASRNNIAWVVVKGVCDWADHKEKSLQEMAAASAASLCEHVLSDENVLDGLRRPF